AVPSLQQHSSVTHSPDQRPAVPSWCPPPAAAGEYAHGLRRLARQKGISLGAGWVSVLVAPCACAELVGLPASGEYLVRAFQRSVGGPGWRDAACVGLS